MKKLLRILAVAVLGVSLTTGIASAGSIHTTGPDSNNVIRHDRRTTVDVNNNADIDVDNDSDQRARSGNAHVSGNTTGRDADTGDAKNVNDTLTEASVDFNSDLCDCILGGGGNSADVDAEIRNTGPDSNNEVRVETRTNIDVNNNVNFDVTNDSYQDARSGDAHVSHNTTGGGASTGHASNSNVTTTSLHLSF